MEAVQRGIEQLVHAWEDRCLYFRARAELRQIQKKAGLPIAGPLIHWNTFRGVLREMIKQGTEIDTKTIEDTKDSFDAHYIFPVEVVKALAGFASVPIDVAVWSLTSRRCYVLTEDMQDLLDATALTGLCWNDVEFPFTSFIIQLPRPISDRMGTEYDQVLVRYLETDVMLDENYQKVERPQKQLLLRLIQKQDAQAPKRLLGDLERRSMKKAIAKKNAQALFQELKACGPIIDQNKVSVSTIDISRIGERDIGENFKELMQASYGMNCACGQPHPEWDEAAHYVVSMCLYLLTMPKKVREKPDEHRAGKTALPPLAITRDIFVHTLDAPEKLNAEEKELLSHVRQGRQVSAHFRKAHYRRRPGTAHDPDAPKLVHVRFTWVKRERAAQT